MSSSVCIVGAGPSGLVAAKNLLYRNPGQFKVSVVDAQPDIGGLWPTSKEDDNRMVHPLMVANQSKHTMHFSDLAWEKDSPQIPTAWMVGQYLQRYMQKYLSSNEHFNLRLGTRVVAAKQRDDKGWTVTTASNGEEQTESFDYLVVASGYFGKPIVDETLKKSASVPVIHSSQYRNLKQLLGAEKPKGRKILVVGGQMSGVEISATIASHLSSEANSPKDSDIPGIEDFTVHHVIQRPVWIVPLHTSPEPTKPAPPFLPLDFASYNRTNRPLPLSNEHGHTTEDQARSLHGKFQFILGTDQRAFSPLLHSDEESRSTPAHLAVSDWYADLVRSGLITLSKGKVSSIDGTSAHLSTGDSIDDIAAVVLATGFDPSPCINYLPADILQTLHHSPQHTEQATALAFHGTHHPGVQNLGFVGFYRSPYWGIMQMQARFIAELWSNTPKSDIFKQKVAEDTSIQRTLSLRDDPRMSQYPMGDYAYILQEFAEALSMTISPAIPSAGPALSHNNLPLDTLTPSRYTAPEEDTSIAQTLLQNTATTADEGLTTPKFVSRAVFRSLLGTWRLERDLKSKLPTHPSGHFSGTAQFLLREQTSDGLKCATDTDTALPKTDTTAWEYLYIEDGEFKTEQGFGFRAMRRYVYRYDEQTDKLSVWFAHPEEQKRADYLFHEVEFEQPTEQGWSAKSGHLCIDDYYDVKYNFRFKAVNLEKWSCEYTVNGPKKDYTIKGTYTR